MKHDHQEIKNTMNFNKVYTVEDLSKLGTVEAIIDELNRCMTPYVVQSDIETFEDLLPYVKRTKKTELYVPQEFFRSPRHELIYILTQHGDGKERKEKLGCKDEYFDKNNFKEAKRWFFEKTKLLGAQTITDSIPNNIIIQASQELNRLKKRLARVHPSIAEIEEKEANNGK